jgi:addiction module HigA family antidote
MSLPENRIPTHPGQILLLEFLVPVRLSQAALARHLGIPVQRISEIVSGKRSITTATTWLLAQAFNTTPGFWMRLQINDDLVRYKPTKRIEKLAG